MTSSGSKVILITGANTGLGYQIVRALCRSDSNYDILIGGRNLTKAQQAAESVLKEFPNTKCRTRPIIVDIESDESIQNAYSEVNSKFGKVDILVNNAGAQLDPQYNSGKTTMRQMWNQSWNVNTVGTQIMTHTFIPLLLKSSEPRLLFITSGTSTLAGTEIADSPLNVSPAKGWPKTGVPDARNVPAYRSSKAGMNMMMREWHRVLKEDGVKVHNISPGYLATGLGGRGVDGNKAAGAQDPGPAGDFIRSVIEGARDKDVGKTVMAGDKLQPW